MRCIFLKNSMKWREYKCTGRTAIGLGCKLNSILEKWRIEMFWVFELFSQLILINAKARNQSFCIRLQSNVVFNDPRKWRVIRCNVSKAIAEILELGENMRSKLCIRHFRLHIRLKYTTYSGFEIKMRKSHLVVTNICSLSGQNVTLSLNLLNHVPIF